MRSSSGNVPPNATVIFDVELIAVVDAVNYETIPDVLPGEPVSGPPVNTASGLAYYDIVLGEGDLPPGPTSTVRVHYSGYLNDGSKFDSSYDRGQPTEFTLSGVIPGWTEGVGSMRVGGKRKLVVPFALAYGPQGRPPTIPPKATLIFDVELIEIVSK